MRLMVKKANSKWLRAGDWVEVRAPEEIARTLDESGALDGLPFMPEMIAFCGRRFQVLRRAEKTCVEYPDLSYHMREFLNNDVVVLDVDRCTGQDHDGCGRACHLFWKSAWLRPVSNGSGVTLASSGGIEQLRARTRTKVNETRYYCQSTELAAATAPLSRARTLWKAFADVRSGSRGVFQMSWYVLSPFWREVVHLFERPVKVGPLKRTPVGNLQLRPGEIAKILTEQEIVQTLDGKARNRGLSCDRGMRRYCGGEFKVRNRLDRMISESTGEMRSVEGTVILDGLSCLCWWNHLGGCPREDYMYWREVWLDRASKEHTNSQAQLPS
jgi:hypothetical protein